MAAVLEYLCSDIFEVAGIETKKAKKRRITPRHLMVAVKNDFELNGLLKDVIIPEAGVLPSVNSMLPPESKKVESQEY